MKKFILFLAILLQSLCLFAATAKYQAEDYSLNVSYTDTIIPGDAIFVRMTITTPKNHKMTKDIESRKATLQLIQDNKKVVESAPFYSITKKKKKQVSCHSFASPTSLHLLHVHRCSSILLFQTPQARP